MATPFLRLKPLKNTPMRSKFLCIACSLTTTQWKCRSCDSPKMTAHRGATVARSARHFRNLRRHCHEWMRETGSCSSVWRRVWHDGAENGSHLCANVSLLGPGTAGGNITERNYPKRSRRGYLNHLTRKLQPIDSIQQLL